MESSHNHSLSGVPSDASRVSLVSVILPVYNRAEWIAQTIESVLSQTYQHLELLVIDDGSTDATGRILDNFGSRITVLKQSHAGVEAARNLGLEHARGEFVAFIDSDDVWYPDKLSRQLPLFDKAEVGLVFGNAELIDYRRTPPRRLRRTFFDNIRPSRGQAMKTFARGCFVPCSSVVARSRCIGRFTPGRGAADYMKWLEISARYELDFVEEPVFEYAIHPGGLSHNLVDALEDRSAAFRDMLEQNREAKMDSLLRRIVFNLSVNLRVARLRSGSKAPSLTPAQLEFSLPASPVEKLSWLLKFAGNQIKTRGRWLIVPFRRLAQKVILPRIRAGAGPPSDPDLDYS
jgi:glycosyltransferase involved in cell wall biosynthesis